ncbi:MAG: phage/plasmid primase, P4 family, partial [Caldisphaera sp.]
MINIRVRDIAFQIEKIKKDDITFTKFKILLKSAKVEDFVQADFYKWEDLIKNVRYPYEDNELETVKANFPQDYLTYIFITMLESQGYTEDNIIISIVKDVNEQFRIEKTLEIELKNKLHPDTWYYVDEKGKKKFSFSACGDDIINAFRDSIITEYSSRIIHLFSGKCYLKDAQPYLESLIQGHVPENYAQIHMVIEYIKNKTRNINSNTIDKTMEEIRPMPDNFLPLENGILDLNTKTILQHTPDYYYVSYLRRHYIPNGKSVKFRDFLNIIFKGDSDKDLKIQQIYEIIAWTLSDKYIPHGAVFLVGSGGEGKSIIVKLIEDLLGLNNISSISVQDIETDKFKRYELYGKYANIVSEAGGIIKSEWLKKATDYSTITADSKNGPNIQFHSRAKFIINTNKMPEMNDESRAFYRRVAILMVFENYLEDLLSPEQIGEYVSALSDSRELDLIFSEVIDNYYSDFVKRKKFTGQLNLEDSEKEYQRHASPSLAYIKDRIEKGMIFTSFEEYEEYKNTAKVEGIKEELITIREKDNSSTRLITIKQIIEKDAKEWCRQQKLQPDLIDTKKLGSALAKCDYQTFKIDKKIEKTKMHAWADILIIPY